MLLVSRVLTCRRGLISGILAVCHWQSSCSASWIDGIHVLIFIIDDNDGGGLVSLVEGIANLCAGD